MKQLLYAILLSITLSACYNSHREPESEADSTPVYTTIAELYTVCNTDILLPQIDITIKGSVISSDRHGYISKELYIDDGTAAAKILIDMYNIDSIYPVGAQITINLKSLAVTERDYIVQIGLPDSNDSSAIDRIASQVVLDRHITRDNTTAAIAPKTAIVSDITTHICGRLVTLENMTHVPTSAEDTNIAGGFHRFCNKYDRAVYIYIDPYSNGFGKMLPDTPITITGIVCYSTTIYDEHSVVYLLPRYNSDAGL